MEINEKMIEQLPDEGGNIEQEQGSVEKSKERKVEQAPEKATEKAAEKKPKAKKTDKTKQDEKDKSEEAAKLKKTQSLKQVEDILAEGLDDFYNGLNPEQQASFRKEGEEAAKKIDSLLQKTKVKIKEVISVIRGWLKTVPGLNKFFVEQSAKIKAEKILMKSGKR